MRLRHGTNIIHCMQLPTLENPRSAHSKRRVGQPTHETALTESLIRHAPRVLSPGSGRSLVVIPEATIGRGRPDALIIVVSKASVTSYISSGLSIRTLTHAHALASTFAESSDQVYKKMNSAWTAATFQRFSIAVVDSLAVEAKIKDWKQAVRQASRFKHLTNRAAIMLPGTSIMIRAEPYLKAYDLGYIDFKKDTPVWGLTANKSQLKPANALWLLELAARELRPKSLLQS